MSRIRTLGASVAALVAGAGMAAAADSPPYGPPPPAAEFYSPVPAFSWSGPYAGLIGGYGWGGTTVTNNGWIAGGYAGANFQTNSNLIVGIEGDFTFTGKSGSGGGTTVSNSWNTTLRGRVGYATDRFLAYGTGGVAAGRVKAATGLVTESATKVGWTVGGGIDVALTRRLTGRLEYRHTDLGTTTFPVAGPVRYQSNDVTIGIGVIF